jgi:hypothetical protein
LKPSLFEELLAKTISFASCQEKDTAAVGGLQQELQGVSPIGSEQPAVEENHSSRALLEEANRLLPALAPQQGLTLLLGYAFQHLMSGRGIGQHQKAHSL